MLGFGEEAKLRKRVESLEDQVSNLQKVLLIVVAKTADDTAQAQRLAEMIFRR